MQTEEQKITAEQEMNERKTKMQKKKEKTEAGKKKKSIVSKSRRTVKGIAPKYADQK